jgi:hypothetical protein
VKKKQVAELKAEVDFLKKGINRMIEDRDKNIKRLEKFKDKNR